MAHKPKPKSSGRALTQYNREHARAAQKNKPKKKAASWQRTPAKDHTKWSNRVTELSKIQNPNDWQENQLRHAKNQAASSKSKLKIAEPTAKDKDDARKEAETESLSKLKGKTSKDPGPGVGRDGKPRTATLEEDRKANAPKPKSEKKTPEKSKLKVDFNTKPGLQEKVKKSEAEAKAAREKAAKKAKRKARNPITGTMGSGKLARKNRNAARRAAVLAARRAKNK